MLKISDFHKEGQVSSDEGPHILDATKKSLTQHLQRHLHRLLLHVNVDNFFGKTIDAQFLVLQTGNKCKELVGGGRNY